MRQAMVARLLNNVALGGGKLCWNQAGETGAYPSGLSPFRPTQFQRSLPHPLGTQRVVSGASFQARGQDRVGIGPSPAPCPAHNLLRPMSRYLGVVLPAAGVANPRPRATWRIRPWAGRVASRSVILLAVTILPCAAAAQGDGQPFRVGFSSTMFTDVNESDAKAAVKVWAQTIARERGIETDPDPCILTGMTELASALRNKQVDMVALLTEEYRALSPAVRLTSFFVGYVGGRAEEEYVLLAHCDSGIESVVDLKGRRLIIQHKPAASLATRWLDSVLLEKGLRPTAEFLGRVSQNTKLSRVVLPVFFRQSDACLVTRTGFDTMSELNPQIGKALKILATSPKVIPGLLCFRADYASAFKDKILAGLRELHLSPAGQQVLTIFQGEKLEEIPPAGLQSTLDLLTHCEKLREASGMDPKNGMAQRATPMTEGRP